MSIGTEILSLRRNRNSSVELLLGMLDWAHSAADSPAAGTRKFAAMEVADLVLMNTAVHAAEAMNEPFHAPRSRRRNPTSRSRPGRLNPHFLSRQRPLFA